MLVLDAGYFFNKAVAGDALRNSKDADGTATPTAKTGVLGESGQVLEPPVEEVFAWVSRARVTDAATMRSSGAVFGGLAATPDEVWVAERVKV